MMHWQLGQGCGANASVVGIAYPIAARKILGSAVEIIVVDILMPKEIGVAGFGELLSCFLI